MSASKNAARFGAALGGVAVGLSALLVGLPASADPGDGGTGSITVHAYEQPAGGVDLGVNDGSELSGITAKALKGVGFTACEVSGINLSTEAGWTAVKGYTAVNTTGFGAEVKNASSAVQTLTNCSSQVTTDEDGVAKFANLSADKLYVVYESTAPANAVTVAAPSLVTLPYPNADSTGWNYNVHVYPKNILAGNGATKNSVTVNDNITYTIDVPVQQLYEADGVTKKLYSGFEIHDTLVGSLSSIDPSVVLKNGAALSEGTDYTLVTTGNQVDLVFTAAGLLKLDGNIGTSVVLTIKAKIVAGGQITNTATVVINGKSVDVVDPNPPTVFQDAQVKTVGYSAKAPTDEKNVSATLNFYRLKASAKTKSLTSCPADPASASNLEMVPFDTAATGNYVTDATTGLGNKFTVAADTYCIYTAVAPKGYKTADPVKWTVASAADTTPSIKYVQLGSETGDLPSLPLTGAAGTMLFVGGGVALLAIGGALYILGRRRREANSL